MKPIPLRLLIHSVTLRHPNGTDRYQKPTYDDTFLSRVRIEPSCKTIRSKDNTERQLASVMFFDLVNSRPSNVVIHADDVVVFGDSEYTVQTVERLYDEQRLHHLEVGLI